MIRSVHISNLTLPNLISTGLVLSQLSGCEATHFPVAATNQNTVGYLAHEKVDSESSDDPCEMAKTSRQLVIH